MAKVRSIPEVRIREDWCKGCGICAAFCPTLVLALERGTARVVRPAACVDCRLCELLCPDFAVSLERRSPSPQPCPGSAGRQEEKRPRPPPSPPPAGRRWR